MARTKQPKAPAPPSAPVGRRFTEPEHAALVAAWDARDDAGLAASRPAGVVLTAEVAHAVARANVAFPTDQIIAAIGEALADPSGIATREEHAFMVSRFLLVAVDRARGKLVLALGRSGNQGDGIGTVWLGLSPWFRVLAKNRARVDRWLALPPETTNGLDRGRFELALVAPDVSPDATDERAALLAAIIAKPDDDAPRLVYADLLQQRGDPHGELITLQCNPATPETAERARALIAAHGATIAGEVTQHATAYRIERGFVAAVTMAAPTWAANGARLCAAHPIDRLTLKPISSAAIAKLASAPALAHLRHLDLELDVITGRERPVELWPLARSPHLGSLRGIDFKYFHAVDWLSLPELRAPSLASLTVHEGNLDLGALAKLVAGPGIPALAELHLRDHYRRTEGFTGGAPAVAALFAALGQRAQLARLTLDDCDFVDASAMHHLLAGAAARSIAELVIDSERFDDAALATLSRTTSLRALQLVHTSVTERAVLDLLRSPAGAKLERLVMFAHGSDDHIDPARIAEALPAAHPLRVVMLPSETPLPARFVKPW